ncbi:MAG: alanine racemase [Nitrospina sp.]|nr:alanine racemase [Nitrospina sp.]
MRSNFRTAQGLLRPGVKTMAVVKADGYGHGSVACARALVEEGAHALGVGILEEGLLLRREGIRVPIQVLGSVFPEEIDDLIQNDLTTTLCSLELARDIARRAERLNRQAGVHVKVNTGMSRLGIAPQSAPGFFEELAAFKSLRIDSVFTHFASADEADPAFSREQLKKFETTLDRLKQHGIPVTCAHSANSAALLQYPASHLDMVRPGILLYGVLTSPDLEPYRKVLQNSPHGFAPVMQWKTRILRLNPIPSGTPLSYGRKFTTKRESLIATLPVGYADGLQRSLSGKMQVLVHGQRVPQVGAICMDLSMIDVTAIPGVQEGDEVVLFGKQGEASISIEEVAGWCGTLPYEIMCGVGKRVPRVHLPESGS